MIALTLLCSKFAPMLLKQRRGIDMNTDELHKTLDKIWLHVNKIGEILSGVSDNTERLRLACSISGYFLQPINNHEIIAVFLMSILNAKVPEFCDMLDIMDKMKDLLNQVKSEKEGESNDE